MIDIEHEDGLMSLDEARSWLESRTGRKFGKSTVYAWTTRGMCGRVLETVRIGGKRFTSVAAIARFVEHPDVPYGPVSGPSRTQAGVSAAVERRAEEVFG